MKSLVKKIFANNYSILLRNTFKIKPVRISKYYLNENISMSDAFLFRTDNNFCSKLRFSDIPKIFFDYNKTSIEINIYDFENNLLKKDIIYPEKISNELIIDKNYLDGKETFGHFFIFHGVENFKEDKVSFSNRCYVGFSKSEENFSFVHGNTYVKAKNLSNGKISSDFTNMSLLMNYKYIVQENFSDVDLIELFICNPTSQNLNIKINGKKYFLKMNCDKKFEFQDIDKLEIVSNCTNLRPIIFTHKRNFYDVHHG